VAITGYVLYAMGLKQMADNKGMEYSWLAWIPLAQAYVLGELAFEEGEERGKQFLIATLITFVVSFIPVIGVIVSLAYGVFYFFVLYKLFEKYTRNSVLHLILSIFIPLYYQIVVFVKRNEEPI